MRVLLCLDEREIFRSISNIVSALLLNFLSLRLALSPPKASTHFAAIEIRADVSRSIDSAGRLVSNLPTMSAGKFHASRLAIAIEARRAETRSGSVLARKRGGEANRPRVLPANSVLSIRGGEEMRQSLVPFGTAGALSEQVVLASDPIAEPLKDSAPHHAQPL